MIQSFPGYRITIKVEGLKALSDRLKKISAIAQTDGAIAMTKKGALVFAKAARKTVPVKRGILLKSIAIRRFRKVPKTRFVYLVGNTVGKRAKYDGWYGRLVEFGTAPHEIKVKRKKILRTKEGIFLGVKVQHPGARAKPWLKLAFDKTWRQALREMQKKYKNFVELKERPSVH